MKKDIIKAIIALTTLAVLGILAQRCIENTSYKVVEKQEKWVSVDSVWLTKPGQEHSLQTSYKYYGRLTDDMVITSYNRIHVGDSIKYIYYRYENSETQKTRNR